MGDSSGGEFSAEEGADALVGHFGRGLVPCCLEEGYDRYLGK